MASSILKYNFVLLKKSVKELYREISLLSFEYIRFFSFRLMRQAHYSAVFGRALVDVLFAITTPLKTAQKVTHFPPLNLIKR